VRPGRAAPSSSNCASLVLVDPIFKEIGDVSLKSANRPRHDGAVQGAMTVSESGAAPAFTDLPDPERWLRRRGRRAEGRGLATRAM
jgi:hypothetical protein